MSRINSKLLARMISSKRGKDGLRKVANHIGTSAPTLSRIEQGRIPDLDTYILLCEWLEVSTDYFIINEDSVNELEPKVSVINHLRADKTLPPDVSQALIKMINIAYENS